MRIRDTGSGMEEIRIRDPGWKKVESGIRDREKHPGSATLSVIIEDESKNLCWLKICLLTLSAAFTYGKPAPNLSPKYCHSHGAWAIGHKGPRGLHYQS